MDLVALVVAGLIALAAVGLAVVTWRRSRPVEPSVTAVRRWSAAEGSADADPWGERGDSRR